jgi:hypothetical protein
MSDLKKEHKPETVKQSDAFAYPTIEFYENVVGYKMNDAFRTGWMMARMRESQFAVKQEKRGE